MKSLLKLVFFTPALLMFTGCGNYGNGELVGIKQKEWFVITSYSIHYTKLYEIANSPSKSFFRYE